MSGSFLDGLLDGVEVEWRELGQNGHFIRGKRFVKTDITETGKPCIHYGEIYTHFGISAKEAKSFLPLELASTLRTAKHGDVVIVAAGETIEDIGDGTAWLGNGEVVIHDACFSYRSELNPKYVSYYLRTAHFKEQIKKYVSSGKISSINSGGLGRAKIPIPCPDNSKKSLEIQAEIVRILDAFTELSTELTAELTTELTSRRVQFNHYRNQLLRFEEGEVASKTLGDFFKMRAGQHISSAKIAERAGDGFDYPCFGGNGIRGFVKEKSHSGDYLLIERQGALCGNVQRFKGQFYATEHAVVVSAKEDVDIDWAFHLLTQMNLNQFASKSAQPGLAVGNLLGLKIAIPPMTEQARIVAILDQFDALTNSLIEGLLREIELRQKQYEYYRDLLFRFSKHDEVRF